MPYLLSADAAASWGNRGGNPHPATAARETPQAEGRASPSSSGGTPQARLEQDGERRRGRRPAM